MIKEEILALIDQLQIDQAKFNKFREYLITFVRQPRCKKGCVEFLYEIFNTENIEGSKELAISLLTPKSYQNCNALEAFVNHHPITQGYNQSLINARIDIMAKVAEYIVDLSKKLEESDLPDALERQVYLRRAVSRLATVTSNNTQVVITVDQWADLDVHMWIDYLTTTLEELTGRICELERIQKWSDVYGGYYHLDNLKVLQSLRTYLDYLDTFLEY